MLGGRAPLTAGTPPRSAIDRSVVTRNAPPAQAQSMTHAAEAHNVPAAPATLGSHNPSAEVNQAHAAPTPSQRSGSVATEANANYPNQTAGSTQHVVPKPPYAGGQAPRPDHNTTAASAPGTATPSAGHNQTPRPPYAGGNTPASPTSTVHGSASQPQHPAAATRPPAAQSAPPASHGQKPPKENNRDSAPKSSNPGMASATVPRPPSNYTYKPMTAYTAHSYAGNSSYGGSSPSYSPSASPYASGRSSYGTAAQTYHPAPSYSAHVNAPAAPSYSPHMSAPSAPHYSAPSYSGGGGGGHSSSSGGQGGGHHR